MRDNFTEKTKKILGQRVGFKCSNPDCRKLTKGPHTDPDKSINIGVAAHITAASKNGPRYDSSLSSIERSSIDNGIWLCEDCAKLIDSDEKRYTCELIRTWKSTAESLALAELQSVSNSNLCNNDRDLIKFYYQCLDRPAFQDLIRQEGSMESFDIALENTILALNTGILRSNDGTIIKTSEGKACIENVIWREKLDIIVDMIKALRKRIRIAEQTELLTLGKIYNGQQFYCFDDDNLANWFDSTRFEILRVFSEICQEAGLKPLCFPRRSHWF